MSDQHEVQQVLARYVRATDERDGAAVASLFLPDGTIEIYCRGNERPKLLGVLCGPEAVARAVGKSVQPFPTLGWSHHTTHDHISDIDGDQAHIDAQFMVFTIIEPESYDGGTPAGVAGARGTITPVGSGYYRPTLLRVRGRWKFATLRIFHDLPHVTHCC